ncbi:MAG TPA: hypothetical protein VGG58_06175 [Candidatus Acidoferrum sp.]
MASTTKTTRTATSGTTTSNPPWGRFLAEKHHKEHEFAKTNHKKHQEYWEWRHSHPDGSSVPGSKLDFDHHAEIGGT